MKNVQAQNNLDNKEEKTNSMGFGCTVSRFTSPSLFGLCQCSLTFFYIQMVVHLPSFYFAVFLVRDMLHEITHS